MKNPTSKIIGIGITLLILSCKTYTISPDSFREQMVTAKTENMTAVEINNPLFYNNIKYYSNNIDRLRVMDKNGEEMILENSPSIEMRVTDNNSKRHILYFDTVTLENDTLKGGASRFIQRLTLEIPIDSITKIELQDGKKKFNYQN